MDWRRVRYGPLRPRSLVEKAKGYKGRNSALVHKFWKKVEAGQFRYAIKKDLSGIFLAQFYTDEPQPSFRCVFEFDRVTQLLSAAAEYGMAFERGYDMEKLEEAHERAGKDIYKYAYLDLSSCDDIKARPIPMHHHEVKVSPEFQKVKTIRDEVAEEMLDEDDLDYFRSCRNTFEIHADDSHDPQIVALQVQKFDMLTELADQKQYKATDDSFKRLVAYALLDVFDFDSEGNAVELSCRFSVSELCMMGCHNSAKGGVASHVPDSGHTKASMNAVSTLEALKLVRECSERGLMTIRPHTMNPKDETNKPLKKEKMFNMLDHPNQKLHYLFHGDYTDRHKARIQSGYMMGVSMVGGEMDEALRLQLGIARGTGRLTDEELHDLRVIQTDFEGFEFHPDKHVHLVLAWARAIRFGSGVHDQHDTPNRALKCALSAEFERKILPDLRVGGLNTVFMTPCIQISGEPDTLTWNEEMHKLMVLMAQWEYNKAHDRFLPDDTPNFEASPKNGDDGLYLDTPYNVEVLSHLSENHAPVKFTTEKRGTFLSNIDADGNLIETDGVGGISYCKTNFVLEDGLITLQRIKQNMFKVVVGNKSTWDPRANMQACISQTQNVYGNDKYYKILKERYERMQTAFGKLSELGRHGELDCRDESGMDHRLAIDYFPTQEEVRRLLYTKDEVKVTQLHHNLARHYAYNVPAQGVAKF